MTAAVSETDNEDNLRSAIWFALSGNGILFLGAGASKDAYDKKSNPLPTGQELADTLASECGLNKGYTLDSIADHFVEARSETALINTLRKNLTVENVGNAIISLSKINWLRVWTTNYDDSYEKSLTTNNKNYVTLTTSDDVANARGNKRIVFHINGFLQNLRQSITEDFVLTSESYATQIFADSNNWGQRAIVSNIHTP